MALCFIVDDHEDTREGFAEYLRAEGFDVRAAAGAEEFESFVASALPDAIVLDLQMPNVDGWQLAARIRRDPRLQGTPLLAVTASVLPAERERALSAGFDAFITKPCDPAQIVDQIRRLLAAR